MKDSSFQFKAPVLSGLEFVLNSNFDRDGKSYFKNEFQVGFSKNEDAHEAIVELTILIESSKESQNQPYTIKLTIGSIFRWQNEFDNEMIEKLLTINAPALLVSYARPIVAMITNSAGCEAYNIPFIDFTDKASTIKALSSESTNNVNE